MPKETTPILREGVEYGLHDSEVVWIEVLGKTIERGMNVEIVLRNGGKVVGFVREITFISQHTDFLLTVTKNPFRASEIFEIVRAIQLPM